MATPTLKPIATFTAATAVASATFSNLPQGYQDLRVVVYGNGGAGGDYFILYMNGDTTSANYRNQIMYRRASSNGAAAGDFPWTSFTDVNTPGQWVSDVFEYAQTDVEKTVLTRGGSPTNGVYLGTATWENTNAITSITVQTFYGDGFAAGSIFAVYGID